jgi:enoyl-[acyl-carrier protein] reductase/trans-2-enoyl-CoA reductase (NAD+)
MTIMPMEVIAPKIRGFICTTSHPAGCAMNVQRQAEYVRQNIHTPRPDESALIIGASTGYGLASRIVLGAGYQAKTLGIFFEKTPNGTRPGSAGYYNSVAYHKLANEWGCWAKSLNGDAFSNEMREKAAQIIRENLGKLDYVIYSLASPRRVHPVTRVTHQSVLKPVGEVYHSKTVDLNSEVIHDVDINPASEQEISDTITVMGGEDFQLWIDFLLENDLLKEGARAVAYSYIGPEVTWPIYHNGTIGKAKDDLENRAIAVNEKMMKKIGGNAWVSVNKAVVTQASSAIPVVPLYISILFKVMREKKIHEDCIEQITRLYMTHIDKGLTPTLDSKKRIRMDDWEMRPDVQMETYEIWKKINTETLKSLSDYEKFKTEFRNLFGFEVEGIDYSQPVEIAESI